jgi:two-component system LytT family sensor kinase
MKKSKGPLILQSIFWGIILFIVILYALLDSYQHTVADYFITYIACGVINVSIFYINYIFLLPKFVQKNKRYWIYIFLFFIIIFLSASLKIIISYIYYEDVMMMTAPNGRKVDIPFVRVLIGYAFISGFFLVSSCIIKFAIDWFSRERIQRELESERREMELQFLKSQLNPHFLFNSLNNIYSLAYQKSEKTPDAIMKLSEIMRYMIYESNDETVALSKEVEYLQNYIELQKIRFKDGIFIDFTLNGEINEQKITPLILISFVENVFKHGIVNDPENPVKINIIANQKILHFSVVNKKSTKNKDAQGGVGLANVERRLQLTYPERYKLNVVNSETHYTCELMIDI